MTPVAYGGGYGVQGLSGDRPSARMTPGLSREFRRYFRMVSPMVAGMSDRGCQGYGR